MADEKDKDIESENTREIDTEEAITAFEEKITEYADGVKIIDAESELEDGEVIEQMGSVFKGGGFM